MKHAKRSTLLLLFCLIFSFLCVGCSEVKEINDMAIISGFSIDFTTSGAYQVSAEIVNKTADISAEETRTIISSHGKTLGDAIENCNFQDSRKIYFSHARTLVLSKELAASSEIESVLDYVIRNYKTRLSMDLVISDFPKAASVSTQTTPSTGLVYFDLEEMIKNDYQYGACTPTKVYQAINTLQQHGTELTIPIVSASKEKIVLSGTAVFQGNKMVGALSRDETTYLLMLQNHLEKAHIPLPKYNMTFQISKSDVDFQFSPESPKPNVVISLDLDALVIQNETYDAYYNKGILSEELALSVEDSCMQLIKKAQNWNADIFGFGKLIQNVDKKTNYHFSTLPIIVECKANLRLGEVH